MAAWRLAESLVTLRNEVNAKWPNRSKVSDGTIGDLSHQAMPSDHNPNADGVVCAFDITNDPYGPTAQYLFDAICAAPQADCKYVIANRQIAGRNSYWRPVAYYGSDPHTSHIHVSVGIGRDGQSVQPYDDTFPWLASTPVPEPKPQGDDLPLHLVVGDAKPEWWLTDWITKRYVQTPDEAAQIVVSTVRIGGLIEQNNNGPVKYAQATVDAVPTLK